VAKRRLSLRREEETVRRQEGEILALGWSLVAPIGRKLGEILEQSGQKGRA